MINIENENDCWNKHINLFKEKTDLEIATILGCSLETVSLKREDLNIEAGNIKAKTKAKRIGNIRI